MKATLSLYMVDSKKERLSLLYSIEHYVYDNIHFIGRMCSVIVLLHRLVEDGDDGGHVFILLLCHCFVTFIDL